MLRITVGQHSDRGCKDTNQDFHGTIMPREPLLGSKGVAVALADGISSSNVSQVASESAVKGFLTDYYCTSEAWSVKTSAHRVVSAINSWLHAQTQRSEYRYERDKGYVCTFSAVIFRSTTAYLFHIGDSRIYRLAGNALEQLTTDHRLRVSSDHSYLSRALGLNQQLELDHQALPMEVGDVFLLATDGVYEHVGQEFIAAAIREHGADLDEAARLIVAEALGRGSTDNLTLQIVRIDELPAPQAEEVFSNVSELPLPPLLEARMEIDGYKIIRTLHASSRSHIHLATDAASNALVALKTPSIDLRDNHSYLKRFMLEEWVARRLNSPHVLKPCQQTRKRSSLYVVMEFIEGQTLAQWMIDNPKPSLEVVRGIVEQIGKGLRAFHRMEMLHQDLRPDNVLIDRTGTVKIIDFGSTRIAGVMERTGGDESEILGTVQYTAPEYFVGDIPTDRSDIFSLGVITYQMLTGSLPFGTQVAKTRTRRAQRSLTYRSIIGGDRNIPLWVDDVLHKAVHPDPVKRYADVTEFLFDLRTPNEERIASRRVSLMERNPLLFWKALALAQLVLILGLLAHIRT